MNDHFPSEISDFAKKYLSYVGWTSSRMIDVGQVEKRLRTEGWPSPLPASWYEICRSVDRLPPFVSGRGFPPSSNSSVMADGFKGYDLYFMASDGSNFDVACSALMKFRGGCYGPLGLYGTDTIWMLDDEYTFFTIWEDLVCEFDSGFHDGFDSLLRSQIKRTFRIDYDID